MTAATTADDTSLADTLDLRAVLVTVTVSTMGIRRKVKSTRATLDGAEVGGEIAEKNVTVTKKLIACPEYDAIVKLDGAFYSEMMRHVVSSKHRKGSYMLPVLHLEWFEGAYADYVAARQAAIDTFLEVYTLRTDLDARIQLGPLFNEADYPTPSQARASFAVSRAYQQVGVPDRLAELSPTLFEDQSRQFKADRERAANEIRETLRAGLLVLIKHLRERLDGVGNKRARLHETTVENLRDFVEGFKAMDITGDGEMSDVTVMLTGMLDGVDRDMLKSDGRVRDLVIASLDEAGKKVATMSKAGAKRRFSF